MSLASQISALATAVGQKIKTLEVGIVLQIVDKADDYTAIPGDHVIADMFTKSWTLLLPNSPPEGSMIGVTIEVVGFNLVISTVSGTVLIGGNSSFVISELTTLRMVFHSGAWYHLVPPPSMIPKKILALHGLNGESYDASLSNAGVLVSSKTVYIGYVEATKTEKINNIYIGFSSAGITAPATGTFLGIYSLSGVLLATSADLSTTIGIGTGIKIGSLGATGPIVVAGVGYYAAFVTGVWGTMPQILRGAISAFANINCPANLPRFATDGTVNRLVLPASITMASTAPAQAIWFGMSA